jgi:hypothetical protein
MRGRLPCRRSRGTRRAPSPQPAAHHHIPPNWKPAQWSRRAAFAMPAADKGHVRTRPVSPGMTGKQYPSSPLAFSPARTKYDDTNNTMTPTHSAVTYPSRLRSKQSTVDRRASSRRAQGGWRDTHAAGVVAQVVPIRATLHGYQHVENLLGQRTDESLAARHLDRPVQVWFLVYYVVLCHRVPVPPPRLPQQHPGVSCVDAGKSSSRISIRVEVLRAARNPSGDSSQQQLQRDASQRSAAHRTPGPHPGCGAGTRVRCRSAETPGDERRATELGVRMASSSRARGQGWGRARTKPSTAPGACHMANCCSMAWLYSGTSVHFPPPHPKGPFDPSCWDRCPLGSSLSAPTVPLQCASKCAMPYPPQMNRSECWSIQPRSRDAAQSDRSPSHKIARMRSKCPNLMSNQLRPKAQLGTHTDTPHLNTK